MSKIFDTYKLGEITNILAGGDLPDSFSTEKTDLLTIPVYSNGEKNNGLWGYTDKPKVTDPAVTISARGSKVGFAAIRKQPYFPIVRLLSLIPCQDILDVNFLFYNLKLNRQSGIGSGQPQITIPDISDRTISVPNLDSQQKIASVLIALDLKIEHNNRINAELEAMAKTVYDYWFVQFDYPVSASIDRITSNHPINNNAPGYKSSGGKMVWCEELKREVPEGWKVGTVGQIADLVRGVSYDSQNIKSQDDENVVPILRATNISGNVIDLNNMVYVPVEFVSEKQILNQYDILMTMSSGSKEHIGKNGLYYYDEKVSFGVFCAKLVAKSNCKFYLYSYTQSDFIFQTIKNECLGTNINNLNAGIVNGFKLIIPANEVLENFNGIVEPIYKKIGNNQQENQQLSSLRDWLLPMLMNGQVRPLNPEGEQEMEVERLMAAEPGEEYGES